VTRLLLDRTPGDRVVHRVPPAARAETADEGDTAASPHAAETVALPQRRAA